MQYVAAARMDLHKLQGLVYHILPPTTAIVDYAIGLENLSANEQANQQFFLFFILLKRQ